ncbi:MAG: nuclear transport factor 2 family protein [Armatimonadota bacterium]|nr:nuclear transport factor 2 family protein [Armatimonadota bacterium]MDR7549790.1 nuclear transport factor 2 family protein [Armatimonadota bacterium]
MSAAPSQSASAKAPARRRSLVRLVRRQVAALNRRDLDGLMALYADDAVLEFPASPILTGRSAIRKAYERFFRDWEEQVTLEDVEVKGQVVTARGIARGRHRAVQLRIPGQVPVPLRAYRHAFVVSWEIADNRIRRHRVDYDAEGLVRQLLGV